MLFFADVLGKPIRIAEITQAAALGSAVYAAAAAGVYPSVKEAAKKLAVPCTVSNLPNVNNRARYEKLYQAYIALYDHFGRSGSDVMTRLRGL